MDTAYPYGVSDIYYINSTDVSQVKPTLEFLRLLIGQASAKSNKRAFPSQLRFFLDLSQHRQQALDFSFSRSAV
jgi:hypothetical protein